MVAGLHLDGDFPCLFFSMKDSVNFSIAMQCNFTEPSAERTVNALVPKDVLFDIETSSKLEDKNLTWIQLKNRFTYFVVTSDPSLDPVFALRTPITVPLQLTPFNFYTFSDTSGVVNEIATNPAQYIANEPIQFMLKFANLSEEYFAGDRLYVEVGYPSGAVAGLTTQQYERFFVDFTDRFPPPYVDNTPLILAVTIPSASVLVITIAIIGLSIYCYKIRQEEKFD